MIDSCSIQFDSLSRRRVGKSEEESDPKAYHSKMQEHSAEISLSI